MLLQLNEGNYTRQNLNQPLKLPMRKGYPKTFIRDSPLTAVGCLQATLRGKGLSTMNVLREDFQVVVSPSLRCIKTASNILKGKFKIRHPKTCTSFNIISSFSMPT